MDFAIDDNDEQVMVVAVDSPTRDVPTETDLVDAMRGRLNKVLLRSPG